MPFFLQSNSFLDCMYSVISKPGNDIKEENRLCDRTFKLISEGWLRILGKRFPKDGNVYSRKIDHPAQKNFASFHFSIIDLLYLNSSNILFFNYVSLLSLLSLNFHPQQCKSYKIFSLWIALNNKNTTSFTMLVAFTHCREHGHLVMLFHRFSTKN